MNDITLTKSGVDMVETYKNLLENIREGNLTDCEIVAVIVQNEMIVKAAEEFKKAVKPFALNAMPNLTDNNMLSGSDYCIKVTTTPRKYDYSVSRDWKLAQSEVEIATNKRKAIEEALRNAHLNEYVDKSSGEIISAIECVSGGEKTVTVTLR